MSDKQFIQNVLDAVVERDTENIGSAVKKALDGGLDPMAIVEEGLTKGMEIVSTRFEAEEYFLPDLLIASACIDQAMEILKPRMASGGKTCKLVIGTVEGDIHDIGKNLVVSTMRAIGLEVIDLGVSVNPAAFVDAVKKHKPDLVGISALITTTMLGMKDIIEALAKEGVRDGLKIIVGGAPLDERFAKSIGADYYGKTVRDAVELGIKMKEAV